MTETRFATIDDLLEWLRTLPEGEQLQAARLLADRKTAPAMVEFADGRIFELTRNQTIAQVAEDTGLSERVIKRAVTNHLRRHPEARADARQDRAAIWRAQRDEPAPEAPTT